MRFIRFLQLYILLMYAVQNGMSTGCGTFYRDCHEASNKAVASSRCVSLVVMADCPGKIEPCRERQDFVHTPDTYGRPWWCASECQYTQCVDVVHNACYKISGQNCSTMPVRTACEAIYYVVGFADAPRCQPWERLIYTPELFPGHVWRCFRNQSYIKEVDNCDEINAENCYMRWGAINCWNISRNVRCPMQPGFCPPDHVYTYTPTKNNNTLGHSEKWTCVPRKTKKIVLKYCHEVDIHNCHKYWRPFVCNSEEHKTECPPLWVDCPTGETYRFTPGIGKKNWSCHSGKVVVVEDCHDVKFSDCHKYEGDVFCDRKDRRVICPKETVVCPHGQTYTFTPENRTKLWNCYGKIVPVLADCHLILFSNCHEHEGPVVCGGKVHEVVCPKAKFFCPPGENYAFMPENPSQPWGCYGIGTALALSPPTPPPPPYQQCCPPPPMNMYYPNYKYMYNQPMPYRMW